MAWLPALALATVIYWSSSAQVPEPLAALVSLSDKLVHAVVYAVLSAAVLLALRVSLRASALQAAVGASLLASLYGLSDEWHQLYVPGRVADWLDVGANVAGAAFSGVIGFLWCRRRDRRRAQARTEVTAA